MFNFLKKRWYFIAAILIIAAIFLIFRQTSQAQNKKVQTYRLKRHNIKQSLSLSGSIDANEHVILRFQSSGRLAWVGVKEGDYVKKYQTIASLDQRDVKNRMQKYLNTYADTRWTFDQTKDDKDIKNIGGLTESARTAALRVLDQAQFDLNNSVLDVELQKLSMEYANLWTPIEGLVTKVDAPFAGVNITPTGSEFEIINPNTIYFSATADQTDVVKLKESMQGNIVLDSYPDDVIKGTIEKIAFTPKTGETGTVYTVKITVNKENADYLYRFGMTGDIEFALQERENVLSIPAGSIKTGNGKKYVYVKKNEKKVKTYVTIGDEIDNETIITSGLKENDVIYD